MRLVQIGEPLVSHLKHRRILIDEHRRDRLIAREIRGQCLGRREISVHTPIPAHQLVSRVRGRLELIGFCGAPGVCCCIRYLRTADRDAAVGLRRCEGSRHLPHGHDFHIGEFDARGVRAGIPGQNHHRHTLIIRKLLRKGSSRSSGGSVNRNRTSGPKCRFGIVKCQKCSRSRRVLQRKCGSLRGSVITLSLRLSGRRTVQGISGSRPGARIIRCGKSIDLRLNRSRVRQIDTENPGGQKHRKRHHKANQKRKLSL